MDTVRPSLVSLVWLVYRDAIRALWALRHLAVMACLISIAHSLARLILYSPGFASTIGRSGRDLIAVAFGVGWIFLLVPFLIAVHRFILFDEAQTHYLIEPKNPRTLRFFGAWLALSVLGAVPVLLAASTAVAARLLESWLLWTIFPFIILPIILCLRMTLLLPALAADAPGATWVNAYQDTKGRSFSIFLIYLAATVPFVVVGALLVALSWTLLTLGIALMAMAAVPYKILSTLSTLASLVVFDAFYVCSVALFAVLASRLFQLLGDRVKHLPGPQTA